MPISLAFSYHFSADTPTCRAGRALPIMAASGEPAAQPRPTQLRESAHALRSARREGRCACAAACRRSWRPTAARRRMRGGAAVSSGCLFGKWIRARRRPLPLLPPAALPPLPAMARDYDHLFKLLIIGDSGEGSRLVLPRPLGSEGRGLRGRGGAWGGRRGVGGRWGRAGRVGTAGLRSAVRWGCGMWREAGRARPRVG